MEPGQKAQSAPPDLTGLLPQPRANARVVMYVTPPMKGWLDGLVESLVEQHPKMPKNVVHQIAFFVLGQHWDKVKDLVGRWNNGEMLSLTYSASPESHKSDVAETRDEGQPTT